MEKKQELKVRVTGGAGYIAASLIEKLLLQGYTVHATVRNLKDESKVGVLRRLRHAETRLVLFEADIYEPKAFESAIHGCHFVFHVVRPFHHPQPSQELTEAAAEAAKEIARWCVKEITLRRLMYTASVVTASPLEDDDASSFNHFMDKSCRTPLHHVANLPYINHLHEAYVSTQNQKLIQNESGGLMEVVSLACGLGGGDIVLNSTPLRVEVLISQLKDSEMAFHSLRFLEELLGKISIVHIQAVCAAHIFCMNKPSLAGRFLVASSYVSSTDIANYYFQSYPVFHLKHKWLEGPRRGIKWASKKLKDEGFAYKYGMKAILDDCVKCATRPSDL